MDNQDSNIIRHHVGESYRAPDVGTIHDIGGCSKYTLS